jgi:hypothetical protein
MAEVNTEEMVSVGKEDTMDVNMEDMADFDIAMVLEVNADDLMADVAEVQTVLQCNNIGHVIDANEIYEKLEELTYISREERIAYVATQLIYKSGVIVEPSVAPEERAFRFSIQSNDSNLAENISWSQEKVPVSELSGSGGTRNQNDVSYSNVIATAYGESVNVHPHEVCQNFINVPESVTVSQARVGNQNQPNAKAIDLDIHNDCCQEFDADVETMMEEAKLIYEILPHHDFEQIYAHVRANKDSDTRLDDVTETFLQIDAASGIAQLPCTEVALTSGMNTTLVDTVQTSPMPMRALSVFPFSAPSNIDNVFHSTTSSDEKLHSNKYSVTANAVFPQETFDADLTHGNFLNSEVTDKQVCQERTESTQTHIFHVSSFIENANEIVTQKSEKGVQHNERKVVEITSEVTELPVEQKPCEESVEGIPLSVEQKACEESVDVSPLSVEQKVSAEVIPLCAGQKLSEESAEDTPLVAQETVQQSKEATPLSVEQKVSGESMQVTSMEDITELSVSKNGDYVIDLSVSETDGDDTLSYTSCSDHDMNVIILKQKTDTYNSEHAHRHLDGQNFTANFEVHESHPSCNVFETLNSHAHSEISASSFNSPDSINADFSIEQEKYVEFSGLDEGISGSTACCQMTLQESGSDTTEILENRSQSYEHTSVTSVKDDITEGAETEEQHSSSHDSTYSDDFINLMDSSSGEDHKDDRNVAKLQELFPGASLDYLIRISLQFDSLTDMANKVLEESPENEQNDDVGDTLSGAKLPESASLPKPPSQGCRKKEVTYKEFESFLPHVDPLLLMEIWDRIGTDYNAVKEFIAQHTQETSNDNQYHMLLSLFPQTDPAFLREKCNVIGSNEVALKNFIDEQLQNKTEAQYHTLQAIFPQVDLAYLREKCIEIGDDETAMRAFIVEQLKNNEGDDAYHTLLAMFPDANPAFLRETVERIGDDEDAMKVFVAEQLEEVNGVQFQTLLAVLPDADPDYLRTIYKDIGNDEEYIKVFLLEALENKDYPTREAFLKRQEMATLQRKYKEEFSIEDFIEMFPDPRKHFYEKNNSSNEVIQNHGIAYLETRYRKIAMENIRTPFKKNNHNLTLTCRELDGWKGPVQLSREIFNCTVPNTEDIPVSFLQEVSVLCFYYGNVVFTFK